MRRVLVALAGGLLVLAMAGPVAAVPLNNPGSFPYHIDCPGSNDFTVDAIGVPGWKQDWSPGDTPWLLLGYTVTWGGPEPGSFTNPAPPGLDGHGHLYGPCTITGHGWDPGWWITDAWFLDR